MITKVQKWGNSLAVRIPRSLAEDTKLKPGESVNMASRDGKIVIAAVRQKFRLADLLKGVTSNNRIPLKNPCIPGRFSTTVPTDAM